VRPLLTLLLATLCLPAHAQELARLFDLRSGEVRFEADRLQADTAKGRIVATGHVRLRRQDVFLEADELLIDQAAGRARTRGNVRIRAGHRVLVSRELEVDLSSLVTLLRGAELYVKEGVTPEALRALLSDRELRQAGQNAMTVLGGRILKGPGPAYYIEDGFLTPCDCGDDPPSWKITARKMTVDPNHGAWLLSPTFHIGDDGIFGLPAIWVPFGDHRTGFLQPQLSYTGVNGWLAQGSFFWAPTRSFDATFVTDWVQSRGYRPGAEIRYAASPTSYGRVAGAWVSDDVEKIHRFNVDGHLRQELAPGLRLSLDLALVSDTHYLAHYFYAVRDRSVEYLTSTLALEYARGDHAALVAGDFYQDLAAATGPRIDLFSSQIGPTVHRLPRASYHLLPRPLGDSPLLLSLRAGFNHFYRLGEAFEDISGDGAFQTGEPARIYRRFDFAASLAAPIDLGGVQISPRLSFRQLFWDATLPGFPVTRGHLVLGGDLAAPFSRLFGWSGRGPAPVGSWRHVLEPVLAYRYVPLTYDRGSGAASVLGGLDDLDGLYAAHRLYAGLRTRIVQKTAETSFAVPLEARLTQGFDLGARALADTRLKARGEHRHVSTELDLSYDPSRGQIDEVLVTFGLRSGRGDSLSVSYNYLRSARHERFDLEDVESPLFRGATARPYVGGTLHELLLSPSFRLPFPLTLSWTLQYSFTLKDILQSVYSLRYESPCRCWSVSVSVAQVLGISMPTVGFFLSLSGLGAGGGPLPVF
jgi:lipopolysaccharide assembly outer membrane protein LptD (OstA)